MGYGCGGRLPRRVRPAPRNLTVAELGSLRCAVLPIRTGVSRPPKCFSRWRHRSRLRTARTQCCGRPGDYRWSPAPPAPSKYPWYAAGSLVVGCSSLGVRRHLPLRCFLPWISGQIWSCVGVVARRNVMWTAGAGGILCWYRAGSIRDGGVAWRCCLRLSGLIVCVFACHDSAGAFRRSGRSNEL